MTKQGRHLRKRAAAAYTGRCACNPITHTCCTTLTNSPVLLGAAHASEMLPPVDAVATKLSGAAGGVTTVVLKHTPAGTPVATVLTAVTLTQ